MGEHLGAPQAVLVREETGLLKPGQPSAGVARQDRGTAGRVDHGQSGVLVTSASPQSHALLDRAWSLPQAWTTDEARCARAGMPPERVLATKPPRAQQRLAHACEAGVPAPWVAGDRVDGENRPRRTWWAERTHAEAFAVSGNASVWRGRRPWPVAALLAMVEEDGWRRLPVGHGATGPRGYDGPGLPWAAPCQRGWRRWLVVRRSLREPTERTGSLV